MKFRWLNVLCVLLCAALFITLAACETSGGTGTTSADSENQTTTRQLVTATDENGNTVIIMTIPHDETADNSGSGQGPSNVGTTAQSGAAATSGASAGTNGNGSSSSTTSSSGATQTVDWGYAETNGNLFVRELSLQSLPVTVSDNGNELYVSKIGLMNGNASNPLFILVENRGDDDVYSATINAVAKGNPVIFNVTYLPAGESTWVESTSGYVYSSSDNFSIRTYGKIVTSTMANISIDNVYVGLVDVYAGEKNGGRGIYIENISGRELNNVVIKYRAVLGGYGLFSAPYQVTVTSFAEGNTVFRANSYVYDVVVEDIQVG